MLDGGENTCEGYKMAEILTAGGTVRRLVLRNTKHQRKQTRSEG